MRLKPSGKLTEAVNRIQEALNRKLRAGGISTAEGSEPPARDASAETVPGSQARSSSATGGKPGSGKPENPVRVMRTGETRTPLHGMNSRLFPPGSPREWSMPVQWSPASPLAPHAPHAGTEPLPAGAFFLSRSYSNHAGSRPYKVYLPSKYHGQAMPLIVMLHGCTQSPDDFAAGTRMNEAAEEHGCLIVYPEQTTSANMQKCWKWFNPSDQERDSGEPSLIAGITREVMREYVVDPKRVYIAGLSAGGAAAAIMGAAYPDLYAAIGVHSGLASGSASDMPSAFAAMNGQEGVRPQAKPRKGVNQRIVPAIVFHGDQDTTVCPRNADAVVAQSTHGETLSKRTDRGQASGGLAYSRTLHRNRAGETVAEQWLVHGAGHAWSGGSPAGSYTLPQGPDATAEMVRFFLEHPLSTPSR